MTKKEYQKIEDFMLSQINDTSHDEHHVYRVLNSALDIANYADEKDIDVLIAACLLHDIGRDEQFANPELCHAQVGSEKAYEFLLSQDWSAQKALHVKECISTHRFRSDNPPKSIEAKIVFDADKLDVCGAIGIARTLAYEGQVGGVLYTLDKSGNIITSVGDEETTSFFQEYNYKLKNVYDSFFTERGKEIALERQKTAIDFYNGLFNEITQNNKRGIDDDVWLQND
ncbi:MAG: HD domain-containing protein [Oscillospiraceae bacterium]|nr:HD domain-containing protein [Oscillospiraceae bacterium]